MNNMELLLMLSYAPGLRPVVDAIEEAMYEVEDEPDDASIRLALGDALYELNAYVDRLRREHWLSELEAS
jgi:hypothetical protein